MEQINKTAEWDIDEVGIIVEQIDQTTDGDIDEVALIIEQVKEEVGQFLEGTLTQKIAQAAQDADSILAKAYGEASKLKDTSVQESSDIVNRAHEVAERIIENVEGKADIMVKEEAARIIAEAEQITADPEKIARKESSEKAQTEADRIIREARIKADGIVAEANREATKVWDNLRTNLDKESEEYRK